MRAARLPPAICARWAPADEREKLAALTASGALFTAWSGQWVSCYYYPFSDDIDCEGNVYCSLWEYSRSPVPGPSFTLTRARPVPSGFPLTSTYSCDNGCYIVDFDGYICPESGGTEYPSGGPGGQCGPTIDALIAEYTTGPYAPDNVSPAPTCSTFSQSCGSANFSCAELNDNWSQASQHPPWGWIRSSLLSALESGRATFGAAIYVSGGYRCPEGNHALPGAAVNSLHMQGRAANMYSTSNHQWTEAQFNQLDDVFFNLGPAEIYPYTEYADHHLHVAI